MGKWEDLKDPDVELPEKLDILASISIILGMWAFIIIGSAAVWTMNDLQNTLEQEGCMEAFESPWLDGKEYTTRNGKIVDERVVDNPFKNNSSEKNNFSNQPPPIGTD